MRKRHAVLTCTYTNILDSRVYRGHSQHGGDLVPLDKNQSSPLYLMIDKSRVLFVISIVLISLAIPMPSHAASYSVDQLRLYTHSRVINFKEFVCIDKIIMQESRYNYLARNGSHYGIGQMRSKHYQSRDAYTQIDLTIAYALKRYKTLCNAYRFHVKRGYF